MRLIRVDPRVWPVYWRLRRSRLKTLVGVVLVEGFLIDAFWRGAVAICLGPGFGRGTDGW
jgi:hypothetical protein